MVGRLVIGLVLVGCSSAARRPPRDAETFIVADDLVVRREHDGVVSVLAMVTLDGTSAAGFVRLPRHSFDKAATSPPVSIARGRAWQALARMLAAKPERVYEAARSGAVAVANCVMFDASFLRRRAELRRDQPGGLPDAITEMQGLLDRSILSCVHRYREWAL